MSKNIAEAEQLLLIKRSFRGYFTVARQLVPKIIQQFQRVANSRVSGTLRQSPTTVDPNTSHQLFSHFSSLPNSESCILSKPN